MLVLELGPAANEGRKSKDGSSDYREARRRQPRMHISGTSTDLPSSEPDAATTQRPARAVEYTYTHPHDARSYGAQASYNQWMGPKFFPRPRGGFSRTSAHATRELFDISEASRVGRLWGLELAERIL